MPESSVVWISDPRRVDILIDGIAVALSKAALDALKAKFPPGTLLFAQAAREQGRLVWRSPSPFGPAKPVSALNAEERNAFAEAVRQPLAALTDLVNDPEVGHIAAAMLTVEAPDALLFDGRQTLIAGWGGWPPGVDGAADVNALFRRTLGPFLPLRAPPVIPTGGVESATRPLAGIRAPLIAAITGLVLLGLFHWPGILRVLEARPAVVPDRTLTAPPDEMRSALRARIEEYRSLLAGNICTSGAPRRAIIDPSAQERGRETMAPGAVPHTADAGAPQDGPLRGAEPPLDPHRTTLPRADVPATGDSGTLATYLERATVFIIDVGADRVSFGSGFFVTKDRVLTNAHVGGAVGNRLLLGNRVMGRLVPAVVESRTATANPGEPDFAVLRVTEYESPHSLALTSEVRARQPVVAVGYPGVVLQTDASFQKLKTGDASAIPETVFSDGTVMVLQNRDTPLPLIHHLALLSQGNSGGPLADACGRVVGVNSFIANDPGKTAHANVSLGSAAASAFLQSNGVRGDVRSGECRTAAAEPPVESSGTSAPQAATPGGLAPSARGDAGAMSADAPSPASTPNKPSRARQAAPEPRPETR